MMLLRSLRQLRVNAWNEVGVQLKISMLLLTGGTLVSG
jgi:hypothetical protein